MKNPKIDQMFSDFVDSVKGQCATDITAQVMDHVRSEVQANDARDERLQPQIQLLILDAIEFGIQLGVMGLSEGEGN